MSTHRFSNFSEILGGDLSAKLCRNVQSLDHLCRPCNCSAPSRIDGECAYSGKCRQVGIVYEVKCKQTGKSYIGCTQNSFKSRMSGHFADVKRYVCRDLHSDSYTGHFQQFFDNSELVSLAIYYYDRWVRSISYCKVI